MEVEATPATTTIYSAVFTVCVLKRTETMLARIKQAGPILPGPTLKQALLLLNYALLMPEAWPGTRDLLLLMAPKMEQAGYRDEWMPYLERGIHLSQQVDDLEAAAELQLQLGVLCQLRSKYLEARSYLKASARGFEQLNLRFGQARALNRLAYVARLQRQFEEATWLVETVQRLLEVENEEGAFSYYVMGLIALDKRLWQEAVDYSKRAFDLWERSDQRRLMGRSLLCRGVALEKMKRYPEAIAICQQANLLFEALPDRLYQAIAQMNLGNVYFALEQPSAALELYLSAERKFRRFQDLLHLAHINHNIGMGYRQLQKWEEAKEAFFACTQLWLQLGNIERWANSMDELGLTYLEEGQIEQAKGTFLEVLKQLVQIQGEPGYSHWIDILTTHLQQASDNRLDQ